MGKNNKTGVKGPGYIGMSAGVRKAADILTQKTGERWTPSEIQETLWSWAKTLYEKADAAGKDSRIDDILKAGGLTHEEIRSTPDFAKLFASGIYRKILEEGGYGPRLTAAERNQKPAGTAPLTGPVLGAKGSGFTQPAFEAHLRTAAQRLEVLRQQRAKDAADKAAAKLNPEALSPLMTEEDYGAFAYGGAVRGEQKAFSSTANTNQSGALAGSAFQAGGAPSADPQQGIIDKLVGQYGPRYQTWPEKVLRGIVSTAVSGATLPGDVASGQVKPGTPSYYNRAVDLAGTALMGAPSVVPETAEVATPTLFNRALQNADELPASLVKPTHQDDDVAGNDSEAHLKRGGVVKHNNTKHWCDTTHDIG